MDARRITTFEIEAIASPTAFAGLSANDRSERLPTPHIARGAITRWLVDAAPRALVAAALYGGMGRSIVICAWCAAFALDGG
jgi:hypothetical protein